MLIIKDAASGAERNLSPTSLAAPGLKRIAGGGRSLTTLEMTGKGKIEMIGKQMAD